MVSINKLTDQLTSCELLTPEVHANDKTPSWDGEIRVHKTSDGTKKIFGRVPIQVKGTFKTDLTKDNISYPVDIADLQNYSGNGGVLYFVIYIAGYFEFKIYYSKLLPLDIASLLNTHKHNKSTINVSFKAFPSFNPADMTGICINFANDMKKQYSFSDIMSSGGTWHMGNTKIDDYSHYSISHIHTKADSTNTFDYLLNNSVCVYGHIQGMENIAFPLATVEICEIGRKIDFPIYLGEQQYFKSITVIKDKHGEYACLGKGIKINMDSYKIDFKARGTLNEQINEFTFLANLSKCSCVTGGLEKESILEFDSEIIKKESANLNNYLKSLQQVQKVLEFFGVNEDLEIENMSEESKRHLEALEMAYLHSGKISFAEELPKAVYILLEVSNLHIALFSKKLSAGHYKLRSFFDSGAGIDKSELHFKNDKSDDILIVPASKFFMIATKDLGSISNFKQEKFVSDIMKYPLTDRYADMVNERGLALLDAFDSDGKGDMLESAIALFSWLHEKFGDIDIYTINLFQSYKRTRSLTVDEKDKLFEIADHNASNYAVQFSISTLVENKIDCDFYFSKTGEDGQARIATWPIYSLYVKVSEKDK